MGFAGFKTKELGNADVGPYRVRFMNAHPPWVKEKYYAELLTGEREGLKSVPLSLMLKHYHEFHPNSPTVVKAIEAKVNCWGKRHRLHLLPSGRIILLDHPHHKDPMDLTMQLGGNKCRCMAVLRIWEKVIRDCSQSLTGLPKGFRKEAEWRRKLVHARQYSWIKPLPKNPRSNPWNRLRARKETAMQNYMHWVAGSELGERSQQHYMNRYDAGFEEMSEMWDCKDIITNASRSNFWLQVMVPGMVGKTWLRKQERTQEGDYKTVYERVLVRNAHPSTEKGFWTVVYYRLDHIVRHKESIPRQKEWFPIAYGGVCRKIEKRMRSITDYWQHPPDVEAGDVWFEVRDNSSFYKDKFQHHKNVIKRKS